MADARHVEKLLVETSRARCRLSLADVMTVGLPAVYAQFGERLVYLDGRIFDASDPSTLAEIPVSVADWSGQAVGLEFGWRHASDCSCRFCANGGPPRHEEVTSAWRASTMRG